MLDGFLSSINRNHETYFNYIILSPLPVVFPDSKARKLPAESSIKVLQKAVGIRSLGNLKEEFTWAYEGTCKGGEWRAYQTNFEIA